MVEPRVIDKDGQQHYLHPDSYTRQTRRDKQKSRTDRALFNFGEAFRWTVNSTRIYAFCRVIHPFERYRYFL
jgi:hypothetical protein